MKQFRTVKRAVLPLLSMLVFALLSMGNMKHVEAATTEISIDINAEKGSSPTYGKTASQSVTRSGSWITLYQPNNYNYRIDYTENTTGKTRIGYVYVKEGSNTVKTYIITQSPSITVTYDKNGGSGSNLTRSVIYGKTYTKVDKPTKTGYDFIGWYTAKTGGSQVTETTIMRQTVNHTLYARWEPKSFTVTFKDGSTTVSTKTVTYDSTYGTLPTRTKTGYDLEGWFTASSGGSKVTDSATVKITSNQTLYAHWKLKSFTISFDSVGGSSVSPKTVTYNGYYSLPGNPTKTGYTFDGWYTTKDGGTKITSSTKVTITANQTLYAHWTANKYNVTFDKNGGSGTNLTRTIAFGNTYGKVDIPIRTGYDFIGWYTSKTGGSQVTETTTMSTAANHTVYARWEAKKSTVSFNSQGGSSVSSKTVTYNSTYGTLTTPVKANYTFLGWYTAASGGTQVTASTQVKITSSQRLYAHWEAKKYTVTYDKNGGDGDNFIRSIAYGSTYTKVDIPTRTGFSFEGWYKADGSQVTETTIMSTAADHTVYAHWTAKEYKVTLDDNYDHSGATVIKVIKTVTYGDTYGSLSSPEREYYTFDGWYTAKTGGSKVTASTIMTKDEDHTLYAHWIPNKYTVTYDLNGGEGENPIRSISYNGTYGKIDNPKRTGYTFAGWYSAKTGGSQITETTLMSTAKDHTVYAHWTANSYAVTFDKNGGSGSNITRSIAFGSTYGKVDNPIRSGYTFKGWYTAKTGGSQVTETTLMTTAADHTVYARWTATGSTSGGSSSCRHSHMSTVGYVAPDCTHDGYEIQRCEMCGMTVQRSSIKAKGHDFYTEVVVQPTCANDGYMVTRCRKCGVVSQSQTLARVPSHTFTTTRVEPTSNQDGYEKVSCVKCGFIKSNKVLSLCGVILDPQNGDVNISVSVIQGEAYGDALPTVKKTGYNFKGWYTAKTGGTKVTSESIVPSSSVVQLYARWSIKTYTVTFDANGGTGGPTSMKKTYGTASVIPEEVPEKQGYECIGWAESLEDANAKKVTYKKGDYFTRNKKMTLYAVWTQRASLVRTDEMGMSIYISYSCVDQLKEEVNSWDGINDTLDCASTDGYPMLDQIRNALYYESSDYRLRDVCFVLKSSMDQVNMSGLEYLEIRIPKSTFSITLLGVYTTEVVQNQDTWEWFNLDSFSAVISNYHTTELSEVLEEGKHYFANQGDYEDDEELFLPELLKIIMDDIDYDQMPDNPTVRAAVEAFIEALKNKRLEGTVGGGMCGPMAAVNMALYFTDPDKQVTKEEVREELLNYFRMENRGFSWVERDISSGDGWSSICDYLDTKLKPLGLDASAGIEGIQAGGSKKQLELTKKMISEEIPVIMSFASETEKLRMLRMAENGKDLYEDTRNPVNSHYVIVTGVYESARGESVYLKVASWGEKYYINWNEYVAKANRGIVGDAGCGYVVIK